MVIGVRTRRASELMHEIYDPFVRTGAPVLEMDPSSAEMSKYAANGMLASRISFMNEIARLCDALGADVESVRRVVGADRRVGGKFLFPGAGYGGSCFPKDVKALAAMGEEANVEVPIMRAVDETNRLQRGYLFDGYIGVVAHPSLARATHTGVLHPVAGVHFNITIVCFNRQRYRD